MARAALALDARAPPFGVVLAATQRLVDTKWPLIERVAYWLVARRELDYDATAARLLLDRLAERGIEKILVLHDFDISGFSIFGTLGTSGRRYTFHNDVEVIDLGLRLTDVEEMGLEDEPVVIGKDWGKVAAKLRRHGATADEIRFLEHARVELNAMTSRQLIDFVEAKLAEHGVKKLVPDEAVLIEHARRLIEQQFAAAEVEKLRAALTEKAAQVRLPGDLRHAVERRLAADPQLSWDMALAEVLGKRR
jgi:hypothetical protein